MMIEKILEVLQMHAENAVDLFKIMTTDRSTSYRKARHSLVFGPSKFKHDWADLYRKRQAFYSLLNKLKREGLITKKKVVRNSPWSVTERGVKKLSLLKSKDKEAFNITKKKYYIKKSRDMVIVAFDVPERERKKRHWLRAGLASLGFKKIQQSVWWGVGQIPDDFIKDLKDYNLLSCVHIFSVNKQGTLIKNDTDFV